MNIEGLKMKNIMRQLILLTKKQRAKGNKKGIVKKRDVNVSRYYNTMNPIRHVNTISSLL